jgi:hypothetical protein
VVMMALLTLLPKSSGPFAVVHIGSISVVPPRILLLGSPREYEASADEMPPLSFEVA